MPKVYIIAEAGVNHNGRLDLAIQLCDAAKAAGVDAVKFQTWKTELIIAKNTEMADYQKANLNNDDTQFEMLKKLEMSYENFRIVKEHCDKIGIQFLSTADETESLDFLCGLEGFAGFGGEFFDVHAVSPGWTGREDSTFPGIRNARRPIFPI